MSRKSHPKIDPIEQAIELALNPGAFISNRACFSFVSDLDEVAARIATLVASEPSRAVTLYETFLAAAHAKAEGLDDSSGSFGQFVGDLYCGWIKARQAAGANPDETAPRLLSWMDDDDYGFCYNLEKDAAKAFDQAGLAAFVTQVRARFAAAVKADRKTEGTFKDKAGYLRDHCVFRPEIDIEDTMNVLVRYDTGATLAYALNAFNAWEGYTVAFNGTQGRLEHSVGGPPAADGKSRAGTIRLAIVPIRGATREITPWTGTGAHQGGDRVMLEDLFVPGRPADKYLRAADERAGAAAILVGMATNRCFATGQPVDAASLVPGLRGPDYAPMPTAADPVPMLPRREA